MKRHPARSLLLFHICLLCLVPARAHARSPVPPQQQERINAEIESIRAEAGKQHDADAKQRLLKRAFADASDTRVKIEVLKMAAQAGGDLLEPFLLFATEDANTQARLASVQLLAKHASPAAIDRLMALIAAPPAADPEHVLPGTTVIHRSAYFALADIGLRHPDAAQRIIAGLETADVVSDDLHDPRTQSLYILTQDKRLLKPFYQRLESDDPAERQLGVTAFRFLRLTKAPPQLVALLEDTSQSVRSWTALTLGEIGDPATIDRLIGIATDQGEDRNVRINAISALGEMRAEDAEPTIRRLLEDDSVNINAAITLSRITGERHPLVPEGYALDFEE